MACVLVVDNDHVQRTTLSHALESIGHRVVPASSGEEAIDIGRRAQPTVVVFDLVLPGLGGAGTFAALKTEIPHLVGVATSAAIGLTAGIRAARNVGAIGFLPKPIDPQVLARLLQRAMTGRSKPLGGKQVSAHALVDTLDQCDGSAGALISEAQREETLQLMLVVLFDDTLGARVLIATAREFGRFAIPRRAIKISYVARVRRTLQKALANVTVDPRALAVISRLHSPGSRGPLLSEGVAARAIGIHGAHLGRLIRRSGLSYREWCWALRLGPILRAVGVSDEQMKTIALDNGFSSTSGLDRFFHRIVGMSPTAFRVVTLDIQGHLQPHTNLTTEGLAENEDGVPGF